MPKWKKTADMTDEQLAARRASKRAYHHRKGKASSTPGYWRMRRYGLTEEQYASMLASQGGRCALCGEEKKLHVDHCHDTNKVRGLLCMDCNTGIGKLKHDPELLRRALTYVCS